MNPIEFLSQSRDTGGQRQYLETSIEKGYATAPLYDQALAPTDTAKPTVLSKFATSISSMLSEEQNAHGVDALKASLARSGAVQ